MKSGLTTRVVAEGLGTGLLVCTVVGSGIMAERLAGGNQAVALLGNTIPTGAILVVLITIFGPLSGAHFNPAVTVVLSALGRFPRSEIIAYVLAQCIGGIAGTALAHLMFDLAPLAIGTTSRTGLAARDGSRLRQSNDTSGSPSIKTEVSRTIGSPGRSAILFCPDSSAIRASSRRSQAISSRLSMALSRRTFDFGALLIRL